MIEKVGIGEILEEGKEVGKNDRESRHRRNIGRRKGSGEK